MFPKIVIFQTVYCLTISLLLVSVCCGQRNINDFISNSIKATPQMYDIYELNVRNYYDLDNRPEYSSELKTKIFKQSTEYNSMLNSLLKAKNEMFNYTYYIADENPNIGKYILSCGCFGLNLTNNSSYYDVKLLTEINYPLKQNILFFQEGLMQSGNLVYAQDKIAVAFSPLPVKKGQNYNQYLLITVPERIALQMEDSDNLAVYYFFNPKSYKRSTYTYTQKAFVWSETKKETHRLFIADGLRIIVANRETGNIYYDKTYPTSNSFIMKGNIDKAQTNEQSSITVDNKSLSSNEVNSTKVKGELNAIGWELGNNRFSNIPTEETGQIVYNITIDSNGRIISAKTLPQHQSVTEKTEEYYRNRVLNFTLRPNNYIKPLNMATGTLKIIIQSK